MKKTAIRKLAEANLNKKEVKLIKKLTCKNFPKKEKTLCMKNFDNGFIKGFTKSFKRHIHRFTL